MSRRGRRAQQRGRRALDYRATMSLESELLGICPYTTPEAAASGVIATPEEGAAGAVTIYDVTCRFPVPVSRDRVSTQIVTRFDVSDSGYPIAPPTAAVVGLEIPFCTHVDPASGAVCVGPLWLDLMGKELLAELIVRVARAYNFDEPINHERGYQPDAYQYGQEKLGGRPYNPTLRIPLVEAEVFNLPAGAPARPRVVIVSPAPTPTQVPRVRIESAPPRRLVVIQGGVR